MLAHLPGIVKIQCTPDLKQEMKKGGVEGCVLILDEVKNMKGVSEAWFADSKNTDIIVEIHVNDYEQAEEITNAIKSLAGVESVTLRIAVEA